jgi:hypothetical protein
VESDLPPMLLSSRRWVQWSVIAMLSEADRQWAPNRLSSHCWRVLRSCVLPLAILSSIGSVLPWLFGSTEGVLRRNTLRSFAEDFQGASRYPVYRACRLVHSLTEHRVNCNVTPLDNWIQWSLGQIYPPLLRSQVADRILERGEGDCSERVAVLQSLFRESRLPTRIVGLGGHVVLEVYANGIWYMADPDYGILAFGIVEQVATDAERRVVIPLKRAGYSQAVIDRYLEILQSMEDNIRMPTNSPISPRLHWIEEATRILLVALPCGLWVMAIFLLAPIYKNAST